MVVDSEGDSNNECNEIVPSVSFEPGTNLYGLNASEHRQVDDEHSKRCVL